MDKHANPLYYLTPVSNREIIIDPLAIFKPTVTENYDYDIITESGLVDAAVQDYKEAILSGNRKAAYKQLKILYKQNAYLIKALFEAVIDTINSADLKLVALTFTIVDENMKAIDAVLLTNQMCDTNHSDKFRLYVDNPDKTLKKVIKGIEKGKIDVADIIEASEGFVDDTYLKLNYCDKDYWLYPIFLTATVNINKIPTGELTLPAAKIADRRKARKIERAT
jgi:hypothetical protein